MKKFFLFSLLCCSLMFSSISFGENSSQNEPEEKPAEQKEQAAEKDNEGKSPLNILFLPVRAFSRLGENVGKAGKEGSSFIDVLGENVSQGYRSQERETNLTIIR